jgi:hypothetical protein
LVWVVQPDDNVGSSAPFGAQWFNYTDDFDPTYSNSSAYSLEDAYGGVGGVVAPHTSTNDLENLAGGMPGMAPGGANRVFIPTSFEGGDNPVSKALIQLNGHERLHQMDGRYFNLVQPYQHHENIPSRGINVYSFGLKPEEHQPSGTCNMSRIDTANLNLTLTPKTVNSGGARTAKVRIFAVNYNVLRIMSGMGGLALIASARKLLDMVVSSYSIKITATFSKCGETLRNPSKYLKLYGFEQSAGSLLLTNPSETEWKWVLPNKQCLRYSPSLHGNLKVSRLQLEYYNCYITDCYYLNYCFYSETSIDVFFFGLSNILYHKICHF